MKEDGACAFPQGTSGAMRLGAFFAHYRGKRFMKIQIFVVGFPQGGY
jgi:hypothetical protein